MRIFVSAASFNPDKTDEALNMMNEFVKKHDGRLEICPVKRPLNPDELIPLLKGCAGYLADIDYVTGQVINECADTLKVISRYGVGYDRVDLAAAKAKGIAVCNTPGANAESVADLAMGLLICLTRNIPVLNGLTKNGEWPESVGIELYGKTLGILGLGAVGKCVARRARGFSMRVLAYDPSLDRGFASENGVEETSFDGLISSSDFISLHLPLMESTRNTLSREVMGRMKKGAIILNTARGGLIDEEAAAEYLCSGQLGGLGLDVYEREPPGISPLFKLDNVVVTPHTAAHTTEAMRNMALMSVRNLIDVLSGRECPYIVNA
jgi:D-3-phosphoglycerate dehydrogenase